MTFGFVDEVEENVIDAPADGGSKVKEFAIYPVQSGLKKVPLSGFLRIKEFEEVKNKSLIDISLGEVGVEVGALDETKEKFIHNLEMRPCQL